MTAAVGNSINAHQLISNAMKEERNIRLSRLMNEKPAAYSAVRQILVCRKSYGKAFLISAFRFWHRPGIGTCVCRRGDLNYRSDGQMQSVLRIFYRTAKIEEEGACKLFRRYIYIYYSHI